MTGNELRTGIDTNIYVSMTLSPGSTAARAVRLAFELGTVLYSAETISELRSVLARPRFAALRSDGRVQQLIDAIVDRCDVVEVTQEVSECRDPKDNMFLALVLNGAATHLLSGDDDLLSMNPWRGIAIVNPQQYLEM